jgi:hypothetical protein
MCASATVGVPLLCTVVTVRRSPLRKDGPLFGLAVKNLVEHHFAFPGQLHAPDRGSRYRFPSLDMGQVQILVAPWIVSQSKLGHAVNPKSFENPRSIAESCRRVEFIRTPYALERISTA